MSEGKTVKTDQEKDETEDAEDLDFLEDDDTLEEFSADPVEEERRSSIINTGKPHRKVQDWDDEDVDVDFDDQLCQELGVSKAVVTATELGLQFPSLVVEGKTKSKTSSSNMLQRSLGKQGLVCSAQGFGAMGLTAFYGNAVSDDHVVTVLKRCLELGINFIDTAEVYQAKQSDGTILFNESVLGKAMSIIGREKFVICSKHYPRQGLKNKDDLRKTIFEACNASLKRLQVDTIDLYYLHRMYASPIQIEDVIEVFAELVGEGKIKYLGLSEAPPNFIRRAHAIHPISAIQQEWSLIARDLEAKGSVVDTCRELGIGIVPYSPVARGFLSGQFQDKTPSDWRASVPYLLEENRGGNIQVIRNVEALAKGKDLTLSQLSLAWVMNQGDDVVPIPGTTKIKHLEENAMAVKVNLTKEEMNTISTAASHIKGPRGNKSYMSGAFQAHIV